MSERDDSPVAASTVPPPARPVRQVRVTDPERDAAHQRLREALDLGALDLDEYGDRYALVISARHRGELAELVEDLPGTDLEPLPAPSAGPRAPSTGGDRWLVAVMGGHEEQGSWDAGERIHAIAVMGGVDADLRHATMAEHLVIDATALMGGIEIVVPDGAEVRMSGFALMGGRSNTARGPRQPGAPLIEVKGFALMGGIDVRYAKKRERRRDERAAAEGRPPEGPTVRRAPGSGSTALARNDGGTKGSWWRRVLARVSLSTVVGLAVLAVPAAVLVPVQERAVMGSTELNLAASGAETGSVGVVMGGATVIVPDGALVDVSGFAFMGGRDCEACAQPVEEGAPTVRVNARALMGGVEIVTESQYRAQQGSD